MRSFMFCLAALLGATSALADAREDCNKSGDVAIAGCTELITSNPKDAAAYSDRGFDYAAKKDYDRAIADQTKAIELNPKFATAYAGRGVAYYSKREYDRAIADCDKAIELKPNFPNVYAARAGARPRLAWGDRKRFAL